MTPLPARPNLDHLRKQAKDLHRLYNQSDPGAIARVRAALPAARGKGDARIAQLALRLHDMQSCIAREHGFASWSDLKSFVDATAAGHAGGAELGWLRL